MIDLTNAPEGATHYYQGEGGVVLFYRLARGLAVFARSDGWVDSVHNGYWIRDSCRPIPRGWAIYNNTLPQSELSDEQRGLLFNHHFNGGGIVNHHGHGSDKPTWASTAIYRAKQKSERELFIDAANKAIVDTGFMSPQYAKNYIDALFNAGFKAPKVGE